MADSCTTGKMMFYSVKDAKKAVNQQKASRKRCCNKVSKSYYTCEHCGAFHLTSKSKGELKRNNKLRAVKRERIDFITALKENDTVSWLLENSVSWIELEVVNDQKALAKYVVQGKDKFIVLRR